MKLVYWFDKLKLSLEGKKTYVVSALLVLVSIGTVASNLLLVLDGTMSLDVFFGTDSLWVLLNGLGLGSLRAAVNKV